MNDSTGRYTTTYDALDRRETVVNPAGKKITYACDAVSQRDHIIDPDGGRFTYSYDAASRLSILKNPQGDRTTFSYDAASRRTQKDLANGTRASFTYDAANDLTKLYNFKSDASVISSFDYKYDNVSNRTSVAEANGDRVTWSYDDTYQLRNEKRSGANAYNTSFTYDALGNRLLKDADSVLTTTVYDAANQIQHSEAAAGRTTYTFDANGNQQVVQEPGGDRTTNTWDYENQPSLYELPSAERVTMTYNADNQRVEKQSASDTVKFIWDNQNYLLETNAAGITTCIYTNEPKVYGNVISQRRADTTSYLHFDALRSTRQATDAMETVIDTWIYDAWGEIVNRTGTTLILLCYNGEVGYYLDPETGLIWVRRRPLQPTIARWTAEDPLFPKSGINKYVYVNNQAIILTDPSGLLTCPLKPGSTINQKTADACCKRAADPEPKGLGCKNPSAAAHTMCCKGVPVHCIWISGGGVEPKSTKAEKLINQCICVHERTHADQIFCPKNFTCCGELMPPLLKFKNIYECNAYDKQLDCLKDALSDCTSVFCRDDVKAAIERVRIRRREYCSKIPIDPIDDPFEGDPNEA